MQRSWRDKRNELCELIKVVSDYFGGDEIDWLREYARDIVETNKDDLDKAIACFSDIVSGLNVKSSVGAKKAAVRDVSVGVCVECGYRPPFCYYDRVKKCSNLKENVSQGTIGSL